MLRMTGGHLEWLKMNGRGKMRELMEGVWELVFSVKHILGWGGGGCKGEEKENFGVEFEGDGGLRS
jgi:hypothetical protein